MSKIANKQVEYNSGISFTGGNKTIANVANGTNPNDAVNLSQLNGAIEGRSWKTSAVVASAGNVNLADCLLTNFDSTAQGITLIENDRVLLKNQSTASQNGIYDVDADGTGTSGAGYATLTRSTDADTALKLESASLFVDEGTNANTAWTQTLDNFTLGSGAIAFVKTSDTDTIAVGTTSNKEMAPSVTTGDEQTTGLTITTTPSGDGYVSVSVNGALQRLGSGVKTKDCYFSADAGVTAKAIAAIVAGDILYWNGVIAGFNLAATDILDFEYDV